MNKGDKVKLTHAGRTVDAEVMLVTKYDTAGMVRFEAMLGGYLGMMPIVTKPDGTQTDLIKGEPVKVEPI